MSETATRTPYGARVPADKGELEPCLPRGERSEQWDDEGDGDEGEMDRKSEEREETQEERM